VELAVVAEPEAVADLATRGLEDGRLASMVGFRVTTAL